MRNLKKFFAVVLVVALMITSMATAFAATTPAGTVEGTALKELGLYTGIDGDLALSNSVKRFESMVMLGKILGIEEAAEAEYATVAAARTELAAKFTDTASLPDWAVKTIAYEVKTEMVQGGDNLLQPNGTISAAGFATMIARNVLADGDIQPETALSDLAAAGAFTFAQVAQFAQNTNLTRGVLVQVAYNALKAEDADGVTVIAKLAENNEDLKAIAIEQGLIVDVTVESVAAITVPAITVGGTPVLPATVKATLSNTDVVDATITWDTADFTTVGEVTVNGVLADYDDYAVTAKVTVNALALAVSSATGTNLKEIVVVYNKPVDKTKATTLGNYTIGGVSATAAAISADLTTVTLTIDPAQISAANNASYALVVKAAVGLAADYSTTVKVADVAVPAITNVAVTGPRTVEVTFSEPIKTAPTTVSISSGIYGIQYTSGLLTNKLIYTISASSLPDGSYPLVIKGYQDFAGFKGDDYSAPLVYAKATDALTATVTSANQTKVVIAFNRVLNNLTTLPSNTNVDYFYQTFGTWKPNSATSTDGKTWTLIFTTYPIPAGTTNLTIKYNGGATDKNITDAWGNKLTADITLPVTVTADVTAPTFVKAVVNSELKTTLYFSEDLSLTPAQLQANFVVKDSAGKALVAQPTATYTANSTTGEYTVALAWTAKLTGGNYTVDVKDLTDISLAANKITAITVPFTVTDLTPIVVGSGTVTVSAIAGTGTADDVIYVTYPEAMAISGPNSVLEKSNYIIGQNGSTSTSAAINSITIFDSANKVVKISLAHSVQFNDSNVYVVIGRVGDAAGNLTVALSGIPSSIQEATPSVTSIKLTGKNTLEFQVNKVLASVLPDAFVLTGAAFGSATTIATIDSFTTNSDGITTTVKGTLSDAQVQAIAVAYPEYTTKTSIDLATTNATIGINGTFIVSAAGQKGTQVAATSTISAIDYRAPVVVSVTTFSPATNVTGIAIKFSEALDTTATVSALYGSDIVLVKVAADGTETTLVNGLNYTVTLVGDTLQIIKADGSGLDAGLNFKVYTNATIAFIRDNSAQHVKATPYTTVTTLKIQ